MIRISIKDKIKGYLDEIPEGVKLLAVSKTKPISDILEAYDAGIRDFGENKVQELLSKKDELPNDIRWHLIGKLQTNKVKYIVGKVCLIHSLSSIRLLNKIECEYEKIQINIGREESKSGVLEEDIEKLILAVEKCNHVKVKGIMVIIPKGDEVSNRYYFNKSKHIYDDLSKKSYKNIQMEILSMGMTSDFKIAIQEGSNLVRIGSGIFGKR